MLLLSSADLPVAAASPPAIVRPAIAPPTDRRWLAEALLPPEALSSGALSVTEQVLDVLPVDAVPANGPTEMPDDAVMDQVTSVSQLTDVRPTDWAFQALQSLVERYGCITGYPNQTFRGNRALSRYEFAAGLNACMDRMNELVAAATTDVVKREDLLTLQRLQDEFVTEVATLRGQLDTLDGRLSKLAANQFSTTAILAGQVILALSDAAGGNPPGLGETNTVLTNVTQLQVLSSFTGKDMLRVGLATGNFGGGGFTNQRALNTYMALLNYQSDLGSQLKLDALEYRFAVSDRMVLVVQPAGFSLSSVLSPNSLYASVGDGAVSRFAAYNPVLRIGNPDAGVGLDWLLSNTWRLQFAYGTRNASQPDEGLFGSDHRTLGVQFLHKPSSTFILGINYINAYSRDARLDTFTGSNNANISGGFNEPATIHALGVTTQWRIAPQVTLGLWGGVAVADSRRSDAVTLSSTYLASVGLEDPFGRKGDLVALMVGLPPKLNIGYLIERFDKGTSFHVEAFYRFRVSDHISITPGLFWVTDPGHISENQNIVIGTVRTTFNF